MSIQPAKKIEAVSFDEWARVERIKGRFTSTGKHDDVFEAIEILRHHPERFLKIRGDAEKRHIVLEYGKRKGIKIKTFLEGGFVYLRRREIKPAIANGKVVFPATSEEWRKIAAKRIETNTQNVAEFRKRKPMNKVDQMLELASKPRPQYSL